MNIRLLHGDFRTVIGQCPDCRFDAVITDLPYIRKCHPLFSDASRISRRVLKPCAPFVTYTGHHRLPELLNRLGEYLDYHWLGYLDHSSKYYRREAMDY